MQQFSIKKSKYSLLTIILWKVCQISIFVNGEGGGKQGLTWDQHMIFHGLNSLPSFPYPVFGWAPLFNTERSVASINRQDSLTICFYQAPYFLEVGREAMFEPTQVHLPGEQTATPVRSILFNHQSWPQSLETKWLPHFVSGYPHTNFTREVESLNSWGQFTDSTCVWSPAQDAGFNLQKPK